MEHGAPQTLQGQKWDGLGWLSAMCCANRCPEVHGVTKHAPPPHSSSSSQRAGTRLELRAAQPYSPVRRLRSQDEQHQPCRERWACFRGDLAHVNNEQLRITCSPRLTSHAACQPPQQWQVLARDAAAQKPSFPSYPSRVLPYCFPAPVSNWRLAYQLFDIHWSTEKGNLLSEQRNRRKKE